ncbi:uncharacterized protein LOC132278448 [Cornus florida]|uniref:uncharacterized protein LOC132278448 n=1 Tax=Cornus florida TaxID=4283 RepID=UPI0028987B56|nr:uncharacterized protein LOC132278448 [Cornus florida]
MQGFHSRYLGVPAILGRSKWEVFQFLLTKIQDRLSFWKAESLSTGGKEGQKQGLLYQLYKAKYFPDSPILETSLGCQGVRSLIGNGTSTHIWKDHWVLTLPEKLPLPPDLPPFYSVDALIDYSTSSWKVDILFQLFPPSTVQEILKIRIRVNHNNGDWSSIWRCRTLSKVRVTLLRRGCVVSSLCPRCGLQEDTVVHLLFYCSHSIQVWKLSPLRLDFLGYFFSFFSGCLDISITEARNRLVFEGSLWQPEVVVRRAVASFWEFYDARTLSSSLQHAPSILLVDSWSPPPAGCVKCNFDASFCGQSLQRGGGAVFHDFRGHVLQAIIFHSFSASSSLEAEVVVCQRAVLCALDLGFSCVWFESDSVVVVNAVLRRATCPSEIASLCFDITRDWRRFSSVSLTHVCRQGNRVAHELAAHSRNGFGADQLLSSLPPSVVLFVVADIGS